MNCYSHAIAITAANIVWQRALVHTVFCFNAAESADYLPVISQPVTFLTGSGVGSQQCMDIEIVIDSINEANEQFSLSLATGQNSAIGNPGAATVTILEGELVSFTTMEVVRTAVLKPTCIPVGIAMIDIHTTSLVVFLHSLARDIYYSILHT